jgi:hypothetical protein
MRVFRIALLVVEATAVVVGTSCYLYWRSYRSTPQYSLALLIEAARQDDRKAVGELVDIDLVVDDFVPQITGSAAEMYGRGLSEQTMRNLSKVATPILPAVKDRARAELPRVIRERTAKFGFVPFPAIVLGAEEYLDIRVAGDTAEITSKLPDRPLEFRMKRSGEKWRIVGVRDDDLARDIARTVGQQIIAIASGENVGDAGRKLGVKDLQDVLKQAEELLR